VKKKEKPLLLGAHLSISGGIDRALQRGYDLQCNTIQIFTKNSNQWKEKQFERAEADRFKKLKLELGINPIISHSSYLINLATAEKEIHGKSVRAMVNELKRCELLGIQYLVIHPGAHRGGGEIYGIDKIVTTLNSLHDVLNGSSVRITLEITAGQGTVLGYTMEHIARIVDTVTYGDKLAFCLDTCHAFAAGYDIRTEEAYEKLFHDIERTIGIEKLKVIHVNDSKTDCGSRIDRHEHIGKGKIGEMPFRWLMNDDRLINIPKIIETPGGSSKDLNEDRENLQLLKSFVRQE
jgi:deoxyribonuclease-4